MRRHALVAGLTALLLQLSALAAEPLRMVVSISWNMPYMRFDGERPAGGIVFDIGRALEKALNMPVTFVVLPRKRIDGAVLAGDVDLRCYSTPQWTDIPEQLVWSNRLFELSDVVFGAQDVPDPKTLDGFNHGATISTVLGYGYPTLEPLFASGMLKRSDTMDQEKVMLMLNAGRTPYGVSDSLALQDRKSVV